MWRIVRYTNFKTHVIPASLFEVIQTDLVLKRGARLTTDKDQLDVCGPSVRTIDEVGLITARPCLADEPKIGCLVDGLHVVFEATDFDYYFHEVCHARPRVEFGVGSIYYKIHSSYVCLCLTQAQRTELEAAMRRERPEALKLAEQANAEFNRRFSDKPGLQLSKRK